MKKKICAVVALIIILGTVLTLTVGLNVSLEYSAHTMIEAKVGQEYKISDIKAITKEVLPKNTVLIQKASEYEDMVCIKTNGITDEQKSLLCQKINEKYNSDIKVEDLTVEQVTNTRLRDIIAPYVVPVAVATVIILAYMGVKFRKQGVLNVILQTGILIIVSEWLFLSLLVITRYPIDRIVVPAGLMIYFGVILTLNYLYEKSNVEEEKTIEKTKNKKKVKSTESKTK